MVPGNLEVQAGTGAGRVVYGGLGDKEASRWEMFLCVSPCILAYSQLGQAQSLLVDTVYIEMRESGSRVQFCPPKEINSVRIAWEREGLENHTVEPYLSPWMAEKTTFMCKHFP